MSQKSSNYSEITFLLRWFLYSLLLVGLGLIVYCTDGWYWRIPQNYRTSLEKESNPTAYHINNFGGHGFPAPTGWIYGTGSMAPDIVLMGDSHAQMLNAGLHKEIGEGEQKTIYISATSCLTLPNITRITHEADWDTLCSTAVKDGLEALLKNTQSILILSESWSSQITVAATLPSMQPLTCNLQSTNDNNCIGVIDGLNRLRQYIGLRKLIIVGEVPGSGVGDTSSCLSRPFLKSHPCLEKLISPEKSNITAININKVLYNYAKNTQYTYFLNPYDIFCSHGYCRSIDSSGKFYYSDKDHLSRFGSEYLIASFKTQLTRVMHDLVPL